MARYTGPKDKKSRRAGTKLLLRGEHDFSAKSGFTKRPYPPGMHGTKRQRSRSEFGGQLLEKQKVKWIYGILERQFRRYIEEARRHKGVTSQVLVRKLEERLDNVIFRAGFAPSRNAARQFVSHGHVTVNGKKVAIPSFEVSNGDKVGIRELSRSKKMFAELPARIKKFVPPVWIELDKDKIEAKVNGVPTIEDAGIPADIQKIVEFYSR